MLSGLQAVLIILIILLIITQTVSIRIKYDKQFTFDFDFTLVSFTFAINKPRENSRSKNRKISISSLIEMIDYALEKVYIEITSIPIILPDQEHPLAYGYIEIIKSVLLSYVRKKAIYVGYSKAEQPCPPLDVTFKISFYHLVCILILYFKERRKSNQKARTRV